MEYNRLVKLTRLKEKQLPITPKSPFKQYMSKKIGTKLFAFSMIVILIISLGFFMTLNFFVNPTQNQTTALSYQPVTSLPVSLTLNLSSPDDNLLATDPNLLISGQTTAGTMVLITINDSNQVITSSDKGDFSQTLKLQAGVNQLIVSAFDSQGNFKSEQRSIYYSGEKL